MKVTIQQLSKNHIRKHFDCGHPSLNHYITTQASQDVKRDLSACYVLTAQNSLEVLGYYTLSSNAIDRNTLPDNLSAKLPATYLDLPTILLGRLAIDKQLQGQKMGAYLLIDALNRCVAVSKTIGALAVVVDPIDNKAKDFYASYGFIYLPGSQKMFLSIKTIMLSME